MASRSVVTTEVTRDHNNLPVALIVRVDGEAELGVKIDDLHPTIVAEAIVHGLKQKLVDAAAIERDTETGKPASAADKYKAILTVYNRITDPEDPQWNGRAEGDGTSGAGLLVRAVAEVTGIDIARARDVVKGWDKKMQAAMRADPSIKPIIDRMKVEAEARRSSSARQTVDTSAVLAGLMKRAD